MATFRGNAGVVRVGASNAVAEVMEFSIEESGAVTPDTVMGDTWESHLPGLKSWTASISCRWDDTNTTGQEALAVGASVTVGLYPEGTGVGSYLKTGTATVTSVGQNQGYENTTVMRNITVTGNGTLTTTTVSA